MCTSFLTPEQAQSVPRLIMSVGRKYVQHINRTYGGTGTLWDSRYKSSVVQAETYLLRNSGDSIRNS